MRNRRRERVFFFKEPLTSVTIDKELLGREGEGMDGELKKKKIYVRWNVEEITSDSNFY